MLGSNVFNVTTASQVPPALEKGDEVVLSVVFSFTGYEDYQVIWPSRPICPASSTLNAPGTGLLQSGDSGEEPRLRCLHGPPFLTLVIDLDATVTETLLLQNISTTDVMVKRIDFTDSQFDWEGNLTLPYLLKAGTSKELELNFTPSSEVFTREAIILRRPTTRAHRELAWRGCRHVQRMPNIQVNTGEDPHELPAS